MVSLPLQQGFRHSTRLAPRAARAVSLARRALDPVQNPFLAAELRAQSRRRTLPRNLLLQALVLGVLFLYFLWLVKQPWVIFLRPLQTVLSRHLFTAVAVAHVWMVLHASNSRVREAAQREETARMWEMLLVTPLSPAEIVLFKSVYPFLYAGLIALLALPIYLLAAATSGVSLELLAMLYVVFGLLMIRIVAPIRPRMVARSHWFRRPAHAAGSTGNLFAWIWILSWFLGPALRPLSPLAGALFITWPVVAATLLVTPYGFYRFTLPPLVPLLVLGPAFFLLNLRWASRRLVTHVAETPVLEPPSRLRRAAIFGTALAALGYAWPRLIEVGTLGTWMRLGPSPGDSIAALGWLLLMGWWILFGVGSLLNMPAERLEAEGVRQPGLVSGVMAEIGTRSGAIRAVAGLVLPPLLVLAAACLLSLRFPSASALPWLAKVVVVAVGAAVLTVALARRVRAATAAGRALGIVAAWLAVGVILVAPLFLLTWPAAQTLQLAAVSPVTGFLVLLPPSTSLSPWWFLQLSPSSLGTLPPWWLVPLLNIGTAVLLGRQRRPRQVRETTETQVKSRPVEGLLSRWTERFAARCDDPVLVKELRLGARRGDGRGVLIKVAAAALLVLCLTLYNPLFVIGFAGGLPLRLVPADYNPGGAFSEALFSEFCASLVALTIFGLAWPAIFSAPILGSATFSQERRRGTLGFLLLTPLTEQQIVRGKLLGAAAPFLLALGLSLPLASVSALLSLSPAVLWTLFFGYSWLLIACLTGGAFGTLASLLLPRENDAQALPVIAMLIVQAVKLYLISDLQTNLLDTNRLYGKLEITAWFVVPLVAVEAALGLLAYRLSVGLLARTRRRDVRFVTEK